MSEVLQLANNVKFRWFEATVGFDCPCGNTELFMSDESEDFTCDNCGRVYRFTAKLEIVKDAEITTKAT